MFFPHSHLFSFSVCVCVCVGWMLSLKLCAFLKLPSASSSAALVTSDPIQSMSPSPPCLLLTGSTQFQTRTVWLSQFLYRRHLPRVVCYWELWIKASGSRCCRTKEGIGTHRCAAMMRLTAQLPEPPAQLECIFMQSWAFSKPSLDVCRCADTRFSRKSDLFVHLCWLKVFEAAPVVFDTKLNYIEP